MLAVAVITAASAVAGALSGVHPTGGAVLDPIYGAALAAIVTVAASRANRQTVLILSAFAVALSRSWLLLPGVATVAAAFATTFQRRSRRRINALIGAVAIQVVMRWPAIGFHGLTALIAAVAVVPVLVSGWRRCRRRTRRITLIATGSILGLGIVLSAPVIISALLARGPVSRGVSLAKSALTEVESGEAPAATSKLQTAHADLQQASDRVRGWWNDGGYLVPVLAQQQRTMSRATQAGTDLLSVAAANSSRLGIQALRYQNGHIDLGALQAMGQPVSQLDAAVVSAQKELGSTGSPWLVAPIADRLNSLSSQVAKVRSSVDLADLAVKEVPGILGADGTRHYIVAFMTPAETRGLGGLIGAYGMLTVSGGSVQLTSSGPVADLETTHSNPTVLTGPADYKNRYGNFNPQNHFQDITYSPDFPSVEEVMAGVYSQVRGTQVDGALILDPDALAALLNLTGPISVPGLTEQLNSTNAAEILLRTQYLTASVDPSQRHDLLLGALAQGFQRLTQGSLPSPRTISSILDPVTKQGRLLFWSSHPADQALLRRLGTTGAFPQPGPSSDVFAVTVANAGNDKIDAYLHQSVSDRVIYDPATGHVTANVAISFQNSAPASGMPPYVIDSYAGSGLPPGTSELWVTIYSRLQIGIQTENGGVHSFSKAVTEDGSFAYSSYVEIASDSTTHLDVTLEGVLSVGSQYGLSIRLQPLANPQKFSVEVTPASGWYASSGSMPNWIASQNEVQRHTWKFAK